MGEVCGVCKVGCKESQGCVKLGGIWAVGSQVCEIDGFLQPNAVQESLSSGKWATESDLYLGR